MGAYGGTHVFYFLHLDALTLGVLLTLEGSANSLSKQLAQKHTKLTNPEPITPPLLLLQSCSNCSKTRYQSAKDSFYAPGLLNLLKLVHPKPASPPLRCLSHGSHYKGPCLHFPPHSLCLLTDPGVSPCMTRFPVSREL